MGSHIFTSFQQIVLKIRIFVTFGTINRAVRLIFSCNEKKKNSEKRDIGEKFICISSDLRTESSDEGGQKPPKIQNRKTDRITET